MLKTVAAKLIGLKKVNWVLWFLKISKTGGNRIFNWSKIQRQTSQMLFCKIKIWKKRRAKNAQNKRLQTFTKFYAQWKRECERERARGSEIYMTRRRGWISFIMGLIIGVGGKTGKIWHWWGTKNPHKVITAVFQILRFFLPRNLQKNTIVLF